MAYARAMQTKGKGNLRGALKRGNRTRKPLCFARQGTKLEIPNRLKLSLLFTSKSGLLFRVFFRTGFEGKKQCVVQRVVNGTPVQAVGITQARNVLAAIKKIYGKTLTKERFWGFLKTIKI